MLCDSSLRKIVKEIDFFSKQPEAPEGINWKFTYYLKTREFRENCNSVVKLLSTINESGQKDDS